MTDIDWLRVDMVCNGTSLALTPDEKRMVVRRLDHRMIDQDDPWRAYGIPGKLDGGQVADRLRTTKRSVQRLREELPPATRRTCPVCAEPMWVLVSGVVEPHPDRIFEECPMSGQAAPAAPKGLAALRPDLYPWAGDRMTCVCAHENPDHRGLFFEGRPTAWRCVTCRVCGNGAWLHERFHRHLYNIDHDYQQCECKGEQHE